MQTLCNFRCESFILRAGAGFLALVALGFALAGPALANGYDYYPAPLAWSPDSQYLLAAWPGTLPLGEVSANTELRLYSPCNEGYINAAYGNAVSPCWYPEGHRWVVVLDGALHMQILTGPRRNETGLQWETVGDFGQLYPETNVIDCAVNPRAGRGGEPDVYFSAGQQFYGAGIFEWHPDMSVRSFASREDGSCFSPLPLEDGRMLFLSQTEYGDPAYERLQLSTLGSPGGKALTAPTSGPPISPNDYHECYATALPGGREVLFQRGGWGDWSIYRINLNSGVEQLEVADAQQPSLSADGRWLLFSRRDPLQKAVTEYDWELPSSVWLRDLVSGGEQQLSAPGVYAEAPAISPDGQWLAWLEQANDAASGEAGGELHLVLRAAADITKDH